MGWELVIWAASAVAAIVTATLASRTAEKPKQGRRAAKSAPTPDRREAHYMRNFWNYDGSEQEEFDG